MSIEVCGAVIKGAEGVPIRVEVDLLRRLPSISIVGLANHAVRESTERVRSAIISSGFEFPRMRVVVNLAPANLPKKGTSLDLPIAIAILMAHQQIPGPFNDYIFVGELGLSGELRPVSGTISMAMMAKTKGCTLILPRASAPLAALVKDVSVIGANDLADVIDIISNKKTTAPLEPLSTPAPKSYPDLSDVRGQSLARRALEISAAGAHHLLLTGPPGCGKSMLSQRLVGILPDLTSDETLECLQIRNLINPSLCHETISQRPFRSPHHTSTSASLLGGQKLTPGEITLAHHGVLFLDEAPEFPRHVLEALREPIEERTIHLCRAAGTVSYPAAIILVLAANPCPCGFRNTKNPCNCSDSAVHRYRNKLSGPLLDRIDLHVDLEAVSAANLFSIDRGESSCVVKRRVQRARDYLKSRDQQVPNAMLPSGTIRQMCSPTAAAIEFLESSMDSLGLSARSALKLLRVSRTIADLARAPQVSSRHVAEALALRVQKFPV